MQCARIAPRRLNSRRKLLVSSSLLYGLLGGTPACSASKLQGTQTPAPALADSGSAQRAFRSLSERWHAATPESQLQLVGDFQRFIADYPSDDQVRLARAYLAWILVYSGDLYEARQLIEATRRGPPGAANDFATVAEAALLVEYGQAQEALKLLRPLQGKVIDPVERFFASQQLVASAMATHLYAEALSHMVDWIVQANMVRRDSVREAARALLARVPRRYLERALTSLKPDPARGDDAVRLAEQQWLYDAITERLGTLAVKQRDRALARRVLDANPGLDRTDDPSALLHLATGVSESAAISGRTAGMLLNLGTAAARRRSSQAAAGFSLSLGFADRRTNAAAVEIVFGDDSVELEQGLAELAAAGASVLLTGFTSEDATAAARFAARERIPVLLFYPPEVDSSYAFVLGVNHDIQPTLDSQPNAVVISDTTCQAADGVPSADVFPVARWQSEAKQSLFLLGDGACTKRVLAELRSSKFDPEVWFGLEAAHLWPGASVPRFHTLGAGRFPVTAGSSKAVVELTRKLGHSPTWHETLGHDASVVVRAVFDALPEVTLQDDDEVAAYHNKIVEYLWQFKSDELWSSSSGSFDKDRQLERELVWQ